MGFFRVDFVNLRNIVILYVSVSGAGSLKYLGTKQKVPPQPVCNCISQ